MLTPRLDVGSSSAAPGEPTRAPVPKPVAIQRVIAAYEDPVIRSYSWGRFKILRQRFLDEIGQYLPERGRVLDIGCGFGLFALYYALVHSELAVHGFDRSEKRIALANKAARKLGVINAHFHVQDATTLRAHPGFDAVYMLDIVHHIPKATVAPLLRAVHDSLPPGGLLIVKDLDTTPAWQRLFAHVLDLAMSPSHPPHYWSSQELTALLTEIGFDVKRHAMVDILPYPHMLYVARRR
jgi:2-polyprenyl-3-methyl-5-hydroxy-6-metoxy-1,4-benzoquinol methylase